MCLLSTLVTDPCHIIANPSILFGLPSNAHNTHHREPTSFTSMYCTTNASSVGERAPSTASSCSFDATAGLGCCTAPPPPALPTLPATHDDGLLYLDVTLCSLLPPSKVA